MSEVYFIQCGPLPFVKIGWALDAQQRLVELQCGNPFKLRLRATVPGSRAMERRFHRRFSRGRILNEWFYLSAELDALLIAAKTCPDEALADLFADERRLADARSNRERAEAAAREAVRADFADLRAGLGDDLLSQITGIAPPSIENVIAGRTMPRLIIILRIWAFDREALPRTRQWLGIKLETLNPQPDAAERRRAEIRTKE